MNRKMRASLLAGAAALLSSIVPASQPQSGSEALAPETLASETLAMLDPIARASSLCGTRGESMLRRRLAISSLFAAPAEAAVQAPMPLFAGVEGLRFPVSTTNEQARRYFQQGMMLSYGFNHAAAIASFRAAQRLDPTCALCFWGEAVAHGPNINAPMDAAALEPTLAALAAAQRLRAGATPAEQALIDAAALRYSADPKADRAALDAAYAGAMLRVAQGHPLHDDIALLAAEAVMNTSPWDYWEADGRTPKGQIGEAVKLVEQVLARNPGHPQAAHLYIHLLEKVAPERAEAAADRLAKDGPPAAGHLVHMPAHIYYRRGRFADSIRANVAAARADEAYIKASGDQGLYRYGYYPHNVHFIVTSAQMAGDMGVAIAEARRLGGLVSPDIAAQYGWIQAISAAPYLAFAQFAAPERTLALPAPDPRLRYVAGMRHYARAVAHAQRRSRGLFDQELAALRAIRGAPELEEMAKQGMPAADLLLLAETAARGRYAFASKQYDEAVRYYREAAAIEDRIPYMEPPYWYYPVRQSLGAALYRAGRYAEAKAAFQEALTRYPANGWALYGLAASERALGNRLEAAAADQALQRAWLGDRKWLRIDRL